MTAEGVIAVLIVIDILFTIAVGYVLEYQISN